MSRFQNPYTVARYVRKDRRIYDFSKCKLCGVAGGCDEQGCKAVVCLACQSPQCMSNGLGGGTCSICYVGLLPGWSGSDGFCSYKGCDEEAVAKVRKRKVCAKHLERNNGARDLAERLKERERSWILAGERDDDQTALANAIAYVSQTSPVVDIGEGRYAWQGFSRWFVLTAKQLIDAWHVFNLPPSPWEKRIFSTEGKIEMPAGWSPNQVAA